MTKEIELWHFIGSRLKKNESVMLLVVAESTGSSPGRAGYKMAVTGDGELCGSVGGGVMEVNLVEQAKLCFKTGEWQDKIIEQVHRRDAAAASGMICSGKQTVIFKQLTSADAETVNVIVGSLHQQRPLTFEISNLKFQLVETTADTRRHTFSKTNETEFVYQEQLSSLNELYIIGGGHCALALSELMSKLDFNIRIFDDRPDLNTIEKNVFADDIAVIDSYADIGGHVESGEQNYVVVMTLGYASDAVVIRQLVDRDFRYFGVLGSKAKMATLMKELQSEGIDEERLAQIRTPIGLPINSRTPAEIAISIAAEIVSVKNA